LNPEQRCGMSMSPRNGCASRELLDLFLAVNFGRIENLAFRQGLPVFDPPPRVIYTVKLCGKVGPNHDLPIARLAEHPRVKELFRQLAIAKNGIVRRLLIQNGLPDLMDIEPEDDS
jgi:hypothetical protein